MIPHFHRPVRALLRLALALGAIYLMMPHPFARGGEPTSIDWRDDYGAAMADARAANRLLWIQFTGPWCPNCTRMERDSFPHPPIVEHSQRSYVALKLRSDLNEQLVAAFNLTAIPATVVVAPNRDIVAFHQGYLGPEELLGLLRDCQARVSSPKPARENPAAGRDEPAQALPDANREVESVAAARLAVKGYCPVSLVDERKLSKGQSEHSIVHEGRTFYFSSQAARERFRLNRDRYVPWKDGTCPVTQLERGLSTPGDPRWGVLYAGRLFLCASEDDRRRFFANPGSYAAERVAGSGSESSRSHAENDLNRSNSGARVSNSGD
jgi:YHS domain-containing protein/thiol-disulfide isomerase/thioredoxin